MYSHNSFYLMLTYYYRSISLKDILDSNSYKYPKWTPEIFNRIKELSMYPDLHEQLYQHFIKRKYNNASQYLSLEPVRKIIVSKMDLYNKSPTDQLRSELLEAYGIHNGIRNSNAFYLARKTSGYSPRSGDTFLLIDEVLRYPEIFERAIQLDCLKDLAQSFLNYHFSITHRYYNPEFHNHFCDYNSHNNDSDNIIEHGQCCYDDDCKGCECRCACDAYCERSHTHWEDCGSKFQTKKFFLDILQYQNRIIFLRKFLENIFSSATPVPEVCQKVMEELEIRDSSLPLILSSLTENAQNNLKLALIKLNPLFSIDWEHIDYYEKLNQFREHHYFLTELSPLNIDGSINFAQENEQNIILKAHAALTIAAEDKVKSCGFDFFHPFLLRLLNFNAIADMIFADQELLNKIMLKMSKTATDSKNYLLLLYKILDNRSLKYKKAIATALLECEWRISTPLNKRYSTQHNANPLNFYIINKDIELQDVYLCIYAWFLEFNIIYKMDQKLLEIIINHYNSPLLSKFLSTLKDDARDSLIGTIKAYLNDLISGARTDPKTHKSDCFHLLFILVMHWYDLSYHTVEYKNDFEKLKEHLLWLQSNEALSSLAYEDYKVKLSFEKYDRERYMKLYEHYKSKLTIAQFIDKIRNDLLNARQTEYLEAYSEDEEIDEDNCNAYRPTYFSIKARIKQIDDLLAEWKEISPDSANTKLAHSQLRNKAM